MPGREACGVPELGHRSWPGLLCGPFVLVDETAEDGPTLDPLLGEVRDRVIGPRRAELAAAMRSPSVVMALVLGQDRPQMPFAEDHIQSMTSVRAVSTNCSAYALDRIVNGTPSCGARKTRFEVCCG
jgi:hypothetical protein